MQAEPGTELMGALSEEGKIYRSVIMHMGYLERKRGWRILNCFVVHYKLDLCGIFLIFNYTDVKLMFLKLNCWDGAVSPSFPLGSNRSFITTIFDAFQASHLLGIIDSCFYFSFYFQSIYFLLDCLSPC